MNAPRSIGLLLVVLPTLGCISDGPQVAIEPSRINQPRAAFAEAADFYALACATCHGLTGRGDGPASYDLIPAPRDYRDPAWQASVTDEFLASMIVEGGAAAGKSAVMPGYPELLNEPELVDGLVKVIRRFGEKSPE